MRNFNYDALCSICALIIGVLLVVWPGEAVRYLVITIGVLFLLEFSAISLWLGVERRLALNRHFR